MYIYICIYMYICVYIHIYTYICVYGSYKLCRRVYFVYVGFVYNAMTLLFTRARGGVFSISRTTAAAGHQARVLPK